MQHKLLLSALLAGSALSALGLHSVASTAHASPALGAAARADEEDDDEIEISLAAAPAAVRNAVGKLIGGATVERVERSEEDGVTEFEIEYVADGVRSSATLSSDGALIELERGVELDTLPPAVRSALEKRFPGSHANKADAVQRFFFEIELDTPTGKREVSVSASGAFAGNDEDGDDDDDDDDDDGEHDED